MCRSQSFRKNRKKIKTAFGDHFPLTKRTGSEEENSRFLEDLRKAVYTAFLEAFVQSINFIGSADQENTWRISFSEVIQIWRNGCIIRADVRSTGYSRGWQLILLDCSISPTCSRTISRMSRTQSEIFSTTNIAKELSNNFPALKQVVAMGVQANAIIPELERFT